MAQRGIWSMIPVLTRSDALDHPWLLCLGVFKVGERGVGEA